MRAISLSLLVLLAVQPALAETTWSTPVQPELKGAIEPEHTLAKPGQFTVEDFKQAGKIEPIMLVKTGHLKRAHWYTPAPGKAFYVYEMSDGSHRVFYEPLPETTAPDTRDITERSLLARVGTNTMNWAVPMLITGLGVWIGATNK